MVKKEFRRSVTLIVDLLAIDRGGPEENCDEVAIDPPVVVTTSL